MLISLALCADAVIGNVQEKTLKQSTISEMVQVKYDGSNECNNMNYSNVTGVRVLFILGCV